MAGYAVIVVGVMITLSSLLADQIALGMPGSGFGLKQVAGTLLGLGIVVGGLAILRQFPSLEENEPEPETVKDEEA